jgi:hypothetical protein
MRDFMPAKFNAYPSYIVVFAREGGQVVITQNTNPTFWNETITGTKDNIIDRDLTTNYVQTLNSHDLASATTGGFIIDYQNLYFNTQLSYKVSAEYTTGGSASVTLTTYYSQDGTNWVQLDQITGIKNNGENIINTAQNQLALRYVKYEVVGGGGAGTSIVCKLYESRLMGSF